MKVTQTGPRDQRKSFAKYKQTLGRADPIIVRRALTFAHAVTHPSSRATAQQRDRFARASQYEASINFEDKNLVPLANRLSFVSKPGTTGTAKVLTGRQAIVSQAIRDQQLDHPIINFFYPCLETRDAAGNLFDMDGAYIYLNANHDDRLYSRKLNNTEFLFTAVPSYATGFTVVPQPVKGFDPFLYYANLDRLAIHRDTANLKPSVRFWFYVWPKTGELNSHAPTNIYEQAGTPKGMRVKMIHFLKAGTLEPNGNLCNVNVLIEYLSPTKWRYTVESASLPPPGGRWCSVDIVINYEDNYYIKNFKRGEGLTGFHVDLSVNASQAEQ